MNTPHSTSPPHQQQQPQRVMNRQQQQSSGSREFQPHLALQGDDKQTGQIGEDTAPGNPVRPITQPVVGR